MKNMTNGDKLIKGVLQLEYMKSEKYKKDFDDMVDKKVEKLFGKKEDNKQKIKSILKGENKK